MNASEKQQHAILLLETYGSLLTNKQLAIMNDKYKYDLSLQEIAVRHKITRSGALDAIKLATKNLEHYETKLHLIKKKTMVLKLIKDPKVKSKIKEIL
ncbi:MAG: hypothetical protein MJ207_01775 [Bacilli bacterium]|nr:hypothetical protein [Bacilli bacterium]